MIKKLIEKYKRRQAQKDYEKRAARLYYGVKLLKTARIEEF